MMDMEDDPVVKIKLKSEFIIFYEDAPVLEEIVTSEDEIVAKRAQKIKVDDLAYNSEEVSLASSEREVWGSDMDDENSITHDYLDNRSIRTQNDKNSSYTDSDTESNSSDRSNKYRSFRSASVPIDVEQSVEEIEEVHNSSLNSNVSSVSNAPFIYISPHPYSLTLTPF
jgi:hypothetical protein